ncbi:MAG: gluconate 2-dehydrogenase subunit 3 family protein [Caldilineaceae bacterium]
MTTFVPQLATLRAVVNCLIPADEFPAGWDGGVAGYLTTHWQGDLARFVPLLTSGLAALDAEAQRRYQQPFAELSIATQEVLLHEIDQNVSREGWPVNPQQWLETVTNLAAEGYYSNPENGGNPDARSWQMVGFQPGASAAHAAVKAPTLPPIHPAQLTAAEAEYDAVVIGAGAAGGIVACVLAEAGQRVLLVERGAWLPYDQVPLDHLRNHRLSLYGHNTGPD